MREKTIRNICIFGLGGVGGYFGGRLVHGLSMSGGGQRITFIARGEHLKEIQKSGLVLNTSERGRIVAVPTMATDRVDGLPVPDLVLLCVKSYDLGAAARELAGISDDGTVILPLLNGVDIYERLREVLKAPVILPACVYVGTHIDAPGVVTQKGGDGIILSGKDPGHQQFNPDGLMRLFGEAGIRFVWNDDPYPAIWEKFMFIAGFGLVTAFSGKTIGEVAADERLRGLVEDVMGEIKGIADAKNIRLDRSIISTSLAKAANFPYETKTSYQRDIEAKGERNEGDLFGGTIIKLGSITGVATPKTRHLYASILEGPASAKSSG
jgi:2-dehydropantoate 2-reductase